MKYWILIILTIALLGCMPTAEEPEQVGTPKETQITPAPKPTTISPAEGDFELAPELTNEVWLNTDEPLRLANLRGKVVLLDMWTFG